MPVEYLQIVSVPVRSQDRAREFYVHGLGWDLLSDEEYELGGGQRLRWLEVRPRGGQTAVTLVAEDDTMRAGSVKGMILRPATWTPPSRNWPGGGWPSPRRSRKHPGRDT
jgi:catechol 2,3-dioxygenase-like lactoylglutathione lyase family enzyme